VSGPRDYSTGTRAALAWLSQGRCYYPGCPKPIIAVQDGEAFIDYQIAHIRDAKPGNRYDQAMTDAERRRFDNLVLLCKPHHELVDKRHPEDFSTETLVGWKADREHGAQLGDLSGSSAEDLEELVATMHLAEGASIVATGGTGGTAPGAGGGGGAAVGPGATGGDGGAGGEVHHLTISDLASLQTIDMDIGAGGIAGMAGGDTVLTAVLRDGPRVLLGRAIGGRAGGAVPDVQVRGTGFFADAVSLRDGLLHVISGLLTQWTTDDSSIAFAALFVFVAERRGHDVDGVASLELSLIDGAGSAMFTEAMSVEFRDSSVAKCVAWANVSAQLPLGSYRAVVSQGDVELSTSTLRVVGAPASVPDS
jgi:hypothetical protein